MSITTALKTHYCCIEKYINCFQDVKKLTEELTECRFEHLSHSEKEVSFWFETFWKNLHNTLPMDHQEFYSIFGVATNFCTGEEP